MKGKKLKLITFLCIIGGLFVFVMLFPCLENRNRRIMKQRTKEKIFITLLYKFIWREMEQKSSTVDGDFEGVLKNAIENMYSSYSDLIEQIKNNNKCYVNSDFCAWEKLKTLSSDWQKIGKDELLSSTIAVYLLSDNKEEFQFIFFNGVTGRGHLDNFPNGFSFIQLNTSTPMTASESRHISLDGQNLD